MIVVFCTDLIIKSRIKEAAATCSTQIVFAKSSEELMISLENRDCRRIIADLSGTLDIVGIFKPLLGSALFDSVAIVSHVDFNTQGLAIQAGFRAVVPRSVFVKQIAEFLAEQG